VLSIDEWLDKWYAACRNTSLSKSQALDALSELDELLGEQIKLRIKK